MSKTVKELEAEVAELQKQMQRRTETCGMLACDSQQIKELIDKYDDDNGIVKVEITHGFEPGKKCYRVQIERYPRIES